jgi:chaperonin GroES
MTVIPLGERVLLKPFDAPEVSKGGIVLPDAAKERPAIGTVIAVSAQLLSADNEVQYMGNMEGAIVLYAKYAGTTININDEDHILINVKDLIGIQVD